MNKSLILSSHLASNFTNSMASDFSKDELSTFQPSAEWKLMESTINNLSRKMYQAAKAIKQPIEWLRKYYSVVLEKEISMKQTRILLETQLAFVMAIFPADIHLLLRAGSLVWFCNCLYKCKKAL